MGSRPALYTTKTGALDSQPQMIKFITCLPMVGGSTASSTTKIGRHDIAEILLKVALSTINQSFPIYNVCLVLRVLYMIYDIIFLNKYEHLSDKTVKPYNYFLGNVLRYPQNLLRKVAYRKMATFCWHLSREWQNHIVSTNI